MIMGSSQTKAIAHKMTNILNPEISIILFLSVKTRVSAQLLLHPNLQDVLLNIKLLPNMLSSGIPAKEQNGLCGAMPNKVFPRLRRMRALRKV